MPDVTKLKKSVCYRLQRLRSERQSVAYPRHRAGAVSFSGLNYRKIPFRQSATVRNALNIESGFVREIEQILDFWFGACGPNGALDPAKKKMWFGDGRKYDAVIRKRFGKLHSRASRGELDVQWAAMPRGRIALIVVLDQMSRHIHRGTPAAFAQDPAAQRLAVTGVEKSVDQELVPAQRVFFFLPFEHAEDLELQRLGVRCFDGLARTVSEPFRKEYESFADYARRHCEIVERFGRFPHRNQPLGRVSTPEEIKFLKQPGSSF